MSPKAESLESLPIWVSRFRGSNEGIRKIQSSNDSNDSKTKANELTSGKFLRKRFKDLHVFHQEIVRVSEDFEACVELVDSSFFFSTCEILQKKPREVLEVWKMSNIFLGFGLIVMCILKRSDCGKHNPACCESMLCTLSEIWGIHGIQRFSSSKKEFFISCLLSSVFSLSICACLRTSWRAVT